MYVCVYHIFISLSVDVHLSWLYILAIVKMNIDLFELGFSFSSNI